MSEHTRDHWAGSSGDRWLAHVQALEATLAPVGDALLAHAALMHTALAHTTRTRGARVVDIGCGGGATTLAAARRVAPDGRVLGVDVAPQLIARAHACAELDGVANANFLVLDAEHDTPPTAPFDCALSRFGVMFFDDTARAFRNIAGWLTPGGALVFACWAARADNPWMAQPGDIVARMCDAPPPAPDAPGPFRLADPQALRALLAQAGLTDIRIESWRGALPVGGVGADAAQATDFLLAGTSAGEQLATQAPGRVAEARAEIAALMAAHDHGDGVRMDAAIWLASARAPG